MSELNFPSDLKKIDKCRVCKNSRLENIISLGTQPLINFLDSPDQQIYWAPLDLVLCSEDSGGCGLVQLKHTVPREMLYRQFWYKSGINQTMKDALADVVTKVEKMIVLKNNDIVVDIGSNDSTLLRSYSKKLTLVGFEPARNLYEEAKEGISKIFNDFFNSNDFKEYFGPKKKAKVVTAISMFYDLDEPGKFIQDVVEILDENGIFVIQMNYLVTMLENNAFDNIVHEHLVYYSLSALEYLLNKYNLEVFGVELNELNGGSIRTYIKHKNCKKYLISENVNKLREKETELHNKNTYKKFADLILHLKNKTTDFIKNQVQNGKKILVYGASTRGTTLLNYYNLNNGLIKAAVDRNPAKWGKIIVGTDIPIISEEEGRREKPDYFFVLPWYFIEEFVKREKEFLKNYGKFIVPLPDFRIIEKNKI